MLSTCHSIIHVLSISRCVASLMVFLKFIFGDDDGDNSNNNN